MTRNYSSPTRRDLMRAGAGATLASALPAWAHPDTAGLPRPVVSGEHIHLRIAHQMVEIDGRRGHAIGINDSVPGPLIRLREGQRVRLHVENTLDEVSSIHWHGLILPFHMDGVPGLSFPGIPPDTTFTYEFPVVQSGTYWYHSHSGLQEQEGLYGPIVIDPAGPTDDMREHVIVLSDYSFTHPHRIFANLKRQGGYYNFQKLAAGDGEQVSGKTRRDWARMRMDPTDISDVTGAAYTYLINGHGPRDGWSALFTPGERVRLRIVNAAAMTSFNVRIPGLKLSIVAADGNPVRPVAVDEFQIAVAETYDVIVEPTEDRAYALVGEAVDRSGIALATLAPRPGMRATPPPLRKRAVLTMKDMGMGGMAAPMRHSMRDFSAAPGVAKTATVQTIAPMPVDRMGEPGIGLSDTGHRVLTYRDLIATTPNPDTRPPGRELRIHLTGNMERYMWAFDGLKLSEVTAPIPFTQGERVRVTLVNDTMMAHPIHLHGHFFELATGHGDHSPRKHTVNVQPGGTAAFDLTADAVGDWAFHCHLLYHMHAGMMQVVTVRPAEDAA